MFFEPSPTPFDLNFRLFGVHVRVHPMHWVMSAILGSSLLSIHWSYLLIWMVCVFFSILLHELGHIFMGRLFGSDGHIVLYSFGGLAIPFERLSNRWKRTAVSFAGPLIQLVLAGLLRVVFVFMLWKGYEPTENVAFVLDQLWFINFYWALLNLLPIWPLDGGQIARELLTWLSPDGGIRASLIISIATAGGLALLSLAEMYRLFHIPFVRGGWYMVLLFGSLAVGSIQGLIHLNQERRWLESHWDDEGDRWDRWRR